jgi:hypothetical protein
MLLERVVGEASIVGVVVFDVHTVVCSKSFECLFCLDCLFRSKQRHDMDILQAGEMINEDGGCLISSCREPSFELHDKACLGGLHLIHGYTLSGVSHLLHLVVGLGSCAPWHFCHLAEKTSCASRLLDFFKSFWYFTISGKHLELQER